MILSEEEKLFLQLEHERMLNHDKNIRGFLHKIFSFYVTIVAAFYGGGFIIFKNYFANGQFSLQESLYVLLLLFMVTVLGMVVLNIQIREHHAARNNDAYRACVRNYLANKQGTSIDKAPYCYFREEIKEKDPLRGGTYKNVVCILTFMNSLNITVLLMFLSLATSLLFPDFVRIFSPGLILGLVALAIFLVAFLSIKKYCAEMDEKSKKYQSEIKSKVPEAAKENQE